PLSAQLSGSLQTGSGGMQREGLPMLVGSFLSGYAFWLLLGLALLISEFFVRSEEHTSELQSRENLVCRLLLEKKNYLKHFYISSFSYFLFLFFLRHVSPYYRSSFPTRRSSDLPLSAQLSGSLQTGSGGMQREGLPMLVGSFLSGYAFWLLLGLALLISEFFVPGVVAVFFGIGALAVGLLTLAGVIESLPVQLLWFALISLVALFGLRRHCTRWLKGMVGGQAQQDLDSAGLLDQRVTVLTDFVD